MVPNGSPNVARHSILQHTFIKRELSCVHKYYIPDEHVIMLLMTYLNYLSGRHPLYRDFIRSRFNMKINDLSELIRF